MCSLSISPTYHKSHIDRMFCRDLFRVGTYTWRHDSVSQGFVRGLQWHVPESFKLYADLPGYLASASPPSTIPTDLSTSLSRPDLVLVSKESIYLFELTVPTNTQGHLLAARAQKEDRYNSLVYDLQCTGLAVDLIPIEIGCLGHFMPETITQVAKRIIWPLFEQAARIAISCSYRIFNSRASPEWNLVDLLS